jgi:hypothetical protein
MTGIIFYPATNRRTACGACVKISLTIDRMTSPDQIAVPTSPHPNVAFAQVYALVGNRKPISDLLIGMVSVGPRFAAGIRLTAVLVSAFGWLWRCRRVQLLVEQHIDADASNCLATTYCAVNSNKQSCLPFHAALCAAGSLVLYRVHPHDVVTFATSGLRGHLHRHLMPRTPQNIVIGGVRGDAAGAGLGCNDGHSRPEALILFSLFFWTPP